MAIDKGSKETTECLRHHLLILLWGQRGMVPSRWELCSSHPVTPQPGWLSPVWAHWPPSASGGHPSGWGQGVAISPSALLHHQGRKHPER